MDKKQRSARSELSELAIRLDQSHRDGRTVLSTKTAGYMVRLILRLAEESKANDR